MSLGFVMLVHTALDRAAQSARHIAETGCPVVIHTDAKVPAAAYRAFRGQLQDLERVAFAERRHRCDWGMWGIVGATIDACEQLLSAHPALGHVYLASGSCLPLRPVPELVAYLEERPATDFIESVTIEDVGWSKGGFDRERFTLRFPFSYQTQRRLFDRYVALQRAVGFHRRMPPGLVPHLGSQWWCLSARTLQAILRDPARPALDRFFRRVWIPDESYFQSLVRLHSRRVESRSLTLSKFDFEGRPHVFYDDHLQLLRRSDCFMGRKIWPRAEKLYAHFLAQGDGAGRVAEPNPGKIDRLFSKAADRRTHGRAGLWMQGRYPGRRGDVARTGEPYSVFEGFAELFQGFEDWLGKNTGLRVHGHLFAPERVEFAGGARVYNGALSDAAALRDYNPRAFLTNLLWATRGERQCFMFGPGDRQRIAGEFAMDANAQVSVITGAWAVPLFQGAAAPVAVRKEAARLQRIEQAHLAQLRARSARARVRIWTLSEFLEAPMEHLAPILDEVAPRATRRPTEAPTMADLRGFGRFLQDLRNQGMSLHLAGDFPAGPDAPDRPAEQPRPYLVR